MSNTFFSPPCGFTISELETSDIKIDYLEDCIICNEEHNTKILYGLHINDKIRTKEESELLKHNKSFCNFFFEELVNKKEDGKLSHNPLTKCKLCNIISTHNQKSLNSISGEKCLDVSYNDDIRLCEHAKKIILCTNIIKQDEALEKKEMQSIENKTDTHITTTNQFENNTNFVHNENATANKNIPDIKIIVNEYPNIAENNIGITILLHLIKLDFFPINSSIYIYIKTILEDFCDNDIYKLTNDQALYILAAIEFSCMIDNTNLYYFVTENELVEKYEKNNYFFCTTQKYYNICTNEAKKICKLNNLCDILNCEYSHPPGNTSHIPDISAKKYINITQLVKSWTEQSFKYPNIYKNCIDNGMRINHFLNAFINNSEIINSPFLNIMLPNYFSYKLEIPIQLENIIFNCNLNNLGSLFLFLDTTSSSHYQKLWSNILKQKYDGLYINSESKLLKYIVKKAHLPFPEKDKRHRINKYLLIDLIHKQESKKFYDNPENKILKQKKLEIIQKLLEQKIDFDDIECKYMVGFKKVDMTDTISSLDYSLIENWEPALFINNITFITVAKTNNSEFLNMQILKRKYNNYINTINIEFDKNSEEYNDKISVEIAKQIWNNSAIFNDYIHGTINTVDKIKKFCKNSSILLNNLHKRSNPIICSIFSGANKCNKIITILESIKLSINENIKSLESLLNQTSLKYMTFKYNIWVSKISIDNYIYESNNNNNNLIKDQFIPVESYLEKISFSEYIMSSYLGNRFTDNSLILRLPSFSTDKYRFFNLKNLVDISGRLHPIKDVTSNNFKTISPRIFYKILVDHYNLDLFGLRPRFAVIKDPVIPNTIALMLVTSLDPQLLSIWESYDRIHALNAWFIENNTDKKKVILEPSCLEDFNNYDKLNYDDIMICLANAHVIPLNKAIYSFKSNKLNELIQSYIVCAHDYVKK